MLKASLDGDGVAGPQRRDKYSEGTGTRGYGSVLGGWHSGEASTAYGGGQRVLKNRPINLESPLVITQEMGMRPLTERILAQREILRA